jgi:hypothetical protein
MPNHTIAANGLRLWSNLRLTLFGFSRDGCAFDQAAGGGLALTVPITPEGTEKNVMFMWGGGAIYLPHADPNAKPRTDAEMRAAVVWTTRDGRSYNVGLSAGTAGPRVSFGGVF